MILGNAQKLAEPSIWLHISALILSYLGSFFVPIAPYLAAIIFLVFCDLYTGTRAAKKRNEAISSKGLRQSVGKIRDYFLLIILARIMEVGFFAGTSLQDYVPLTFIVGAYIGMVEFKSNAENLAETTGLDIWKVIAEWLSKKGKGNSNS